MKIKTKIQSVCVLGLLGAAALTACSRDKAADKSRTEIANLRRSDVTRARPPGVAGSVTSFSLSAGACARVADLKRQASPELPSFAFLAQAETKTERDGTVKSLSGAMDVARNAFLQLYFGEKFELDSLPAFIDKAEASHRAGELSGVKLTALKAICKLSSSSCRKKQFTATREKLQEKFPGINGVAGPLKDSIPMLLIQKVAPNPAQPFAGMDADALVASISGSMPLFVSAEWDRARDDVQASLDAAISGLASDSAQERYCALTLWQRSLAQLLSLKGYESVDYQTLGSRKAVTSKLGAMSTKHKGFAKKPYFGSMVIVNEETNPVLTPEMLAAYDPTQNLIVPAERIAFGQPVARSAGLSAQLAMLEMLVSFYEATSPAGPWVGSAANYRLGDLAGEKTPHVLPDSIHPLALGMLAMNFKNIAALAIHKVNGEGAVLQEGQVAKGIMLADRADWTVRASDVSTLVRVVAQLQTVLAQFEQRPAVDWKGFHPHYEPAALAKLVGSRMFGEEELERLLPSAAERESVLVDSLKRLHLPLAFLVVALTPDATREGACAGEVRWDPDTGSKQTLRACDPSERAGLLAARETLSRLTASTVLMPK